MAAPELGDLVQQYVNDLTAHPAVQAWCEKAAAAPEVIEHAERVTQSYC